MTNKPPPKEPPPPIPSELQNKSKTKAQADTQETQNKVPKGKTAPATSPRRLRSRSRTTRVHFQADHAPVVSHVESTPCPAEGSEKVGSSHEKSSGSHHGTARENGNHEKKDSSLMNDKKSLCDDSTCRSINLESKGLAGATGSEPTVSRPLHTVATSQSASSSGSSGRALGDGRQLNNLTPGQKTGESTASEAKESNLKNRDLNLETSGGHLTAVPVPAQLNPNQVTKTSIYQSLASQPVNNLSVNTTALKATESKSNSHESKTETSGGHLAAAPGSAPGPAPGSATGSAPGPAQLDHSRVAKTIIYQNLASHPVNTTAVKVRDANSINHDLNIENTEGHLRVLPNPAQLDPDRFTRTSGYQSPAPQPFDTTASSQPIPHYRLWASSQREDAPYNTPYNTVDQNNWNIGGGNYGTFERPAALSNGHMASRRVVEDPEENIDPRLRSGYQDPAALLDRTATSQPNPRRRPHYLSQSDYQGGTGYYVDQNVREAFNQNESAGRSEEPRNKYRKLAPPDGRSTPLDDEYMANRRSLNTNINAASSLNTGGYMDTNSRYAAQSAFPNNGFRGTYMSPWDHQQPAPYSSRGVANSQSDARYRSPARNAGEPHPRLDNSGSELGYASAYINHHNGYQFPGQVTGSEDRYYGPERNASSNSNSSHLTSSSSQREHNQSGSAPIQEANYGRISNNVRDHFGIPDQITRSVDGHTNPHQIAPPGNGYHGPRTANSGMPANSPPRMNQATMPVPEPMPRPQHIPDLINELKEWENKTWADYWNSPVGREGLRLAGELEFTADEWRNMFEEDRRDREPVVQQHRLGSLPPPSTFGDSTIFPTNNQGAGRAPGANVEGEQQYENGWRADREYGYGWNGSMGDVNREWQRR